MLQGDEAVGAVARLAVLIDLVFKSTLQPGLSGKGTHQRQSFDRFSKQACQFAHLLLAAFGGGHHLGSEQADQPDDQGCQQQDRCRQLPIEPKHVAEDSDQLKNTGKGVMNGLVQNFADTIRVFRQSVGEVTGRQFFQGS